MGDRLAIDVDTLGSCRPSADRDVVAHAVTKLALFLSFRAQVALTPPSHRAGLSLARRITPDLHEGAHIHVGEGVGWRWKIRENGNRFEAGRALGLAPGTARHRTRSSTSPG